MTGNDEIVCVSEKIIFVTIASERYENVRVKKTLDNFCMFRQTTNTATKWVRDGRPKVARISRKSR